MPSTRASDTSEPSLFWATLGYARAWWATDGINRALVERKGGFDAALIQRIGLEYRVWRGVTAQKARRDASKVKPQSRLTAEARAARDQLVQRLCDHFNREARSWPTGLLERAKRCEEIMQAGIAIKCFADAQISGTTKFMWFLKPDRWTMFDDLAATGLGVKKTKSSLDRMRAFYSRLAEKGFEACAGEMQNRIDTTIFKGMPATRICDRLLMDNALFKTAGAFQLTQEIEQRSSFARLLPANVGNDLEALAKDLERRFGDTGLIECK